MTRWKFFCFLPSAVATQGYGVDPASEVDLTSALSLNLENIRGVAQVPGLHNNAPAFLFEGKVLDVRFIYMKRVKKFCQEDY